MIKPYSILALQPPHVVSGRPERPQSSQKYDEKDEGAQSANNTAQPVEYEPSLTDMLFHDPALAAITSGAAPEGAVASRPWTQNSFADSSLGRGESDFVRFLNAR